MDLNAPAGWASKRGLRSCQRVNSLFLPCYWNSITTEVFAVANGVLISLMCDPAQGTSSEPRRIFVVPAAVFYQHSFSVQGDLKSVYSRLVLYYPTMDTAGVGIR